MSPDMSHGIPVCKIIHEKENSPLLKNGGGEEEGETLNTKSCKKKKKESKYLEKEAKLKCFFGTEHFCI